MKKLLYILFAVLFAQETNCWATEGFDYGSSDFKYITVNNYGVYVSGFSESGLNKLTSHPTVNLPYYDGSSSDRHLVVGVAADAFKGQTKIDSIIIPTAIKYINENAFANCTGLNAVEFLDGSAVDGGVGMAINTNNYGLHGSAFSGCTNLKRVYLRNPKMVTTDYSNSNATLKTTFPYAKHFYIGNGIKKIGKFAFYTTTASNDTVYVHIQPNSEFGYMAFYGNKYVAIKGGSVKTVGSFAFGVNPSITSAYQAHVAIDMTSVDSIADNAFADCKYPTFCEHKAGVYDTLHLEKCRYIGENAIRNYNDMVLYVSTDRIGENAFTKASVREVHIQSMILADNNYTKTKNLATMFPNVKSVYFHNVSRVGNYAFYNSNFLTEAYLYSVGYVGAYAFSQDDGGFSQLQTVVGKSINSIYHHAFANLHHLKEVDFPNAQTLGSRCFQNCISLEKANFKSMPYFPEYAFCGCENLTYVIAPDLQNVGDSAFCGCRNFTGIEVADGNEIQHKFPRISIAHKSAFEGCSKLTSAVFEGDKGVEVIYPRAFYGCSSLNSTSDLVAQFTESIGDSAFWKTSVSEVMLSDSVTSLGKGVFPALQKLDIESSTLLSDNSNLFDKVSLVNDGTAILSVGNYQLKMMPISANKFHAANDLHLKKIILHYSVTDISDYSFYNLIADSIYIYQNADFKCDISHNKMTCNKNLTINSPAMFKNNKSGKTFSATKNLFSVFGTKFRNLDGFFPSSADLVCDAYAFYANSSSNLQSVRIKFEAIKDSAFSGNSNLKDIPLRSAAYIGQNAFDGCKLGKYVSPTTGSLEIDKDAFKGNPLEIICIGTAEGETTIDASAFSAVSPRLVIDESNRLTLTNAETDAKIITGAETKAKTFRGSPFTYSISSQRMKCSIEDVNMNNGLGGDDVQLIYNAMK